MSRFADEASRRRQHAHERADDPAVQRAADHEQRLDERVLAVRVEPGADLARGAGTPSTTPTITATVTAKPNSAWPTMCCDLVERAPEDVAEDAEERRPQRRMPTMLYGMKRR